jgi:hypothetical protein
MCRIERLWDAAVNCCATDCRLAVTLVAWILNICGRIAANGYRFSSFQAALQALLQSS